MPNKAKARIAFWSVRSAIPKTWSRLLGASSVALFFAAWCVASYVEVDREGSVQALVPHFFLPAPHEVVKALLYLFFEQNLMGAIGVSGLLIAKAFALSVLVALPLGILMGSFETVNRFFDPLVAPTRYLPISAFIPILILWFGIDEKQKIAFLFIGTVVYLLPAVVDAVRAVPEELVQTAFTLGASRRQVITTVLIPAALPQIFDGFRVLNAISWTYIILAEMVNAKTGLGYLLQLAQQHTKPSWSFAGILVVGVIGITTDLVLRAINSLLFPWREADV